MSVVYTIPNSKLELLERHTSNPPWITKLSTTQYGQFLVSGIVGILIGVGSEIRTHIAKWNGGPISGKSSLDPGCEGDDTSVLEC